MIKGGILEINRSRACKRGEGIKCDTAKKTLIGLQQ